MVDTQKAPGSLPIMGDRTVVHTTQQSSCEIATTAKGDALVTVKVYDDNPDEATVKATSLYLRSTAAIAGVKAERGKDATK